jgi:hypothetical protein
MRILTTARLQRLFIFLLLLAICVSTVIADTAGPNSPGTAVNDTSIGTIPWTSPGNITSSNELRAAANLNDFEISNYLIARNFNFSIPAGAIINGIMVTIERQKEGVPGIIHDYSLKLLKNGIIQGSNKANQIEWTANYDSNVTYGSPTDLWALSLTPADLNNISFGVAIAAIKNNTNGNSFAARVDNIRVTVYYTPDTTPPNVTVPANMTEEATSPAGATATFSATAVDNIDGAITPTCIPISGSTFPLGLTKVNCTATDSAGNKGSAVFSITVHDTTLPIVTIPANMTEEATSPAGATATFSATAVDNIDGAITLTCIPISGSTFPLGLTTVNCTATDSSGNSGPNLFTVTVVDTTAPVITIIGASIANITAGNSYTDAGATALDNYDGNITGAIVSSITVNAHDAGTYNVTYSINDSSGNTASATRTVNVQAQPDSHYGLGEYAFSHFAQQAPAPSAAPASAAAAPAAAPAPAAIAAPGAAQSGGEAQGMAAEQGGAAMTAPIGGNPAPSDNEISGAAVEATTGNQITGAVTGFFNKTKWYWLAGLIVFVMMLLGYWDYRRRKRQGAENSAD